MSSESLTKASRWRGQLGTATAIASLAVAWLAVAAVPLALWRNSLGLTGAGLPSRDPVDDARRIAAQVNRAAVRVPFSAKCLPRAVALSWILRWKGIRHAVVFAVRPKHLRGLPDPLHAWVEIGGVKVIGELPGPWLEILRLGA